MELDDSPERPWPLFDRWFDLAKTHETNNPEAMTLATVSADGRPELRTMLLKQIDSAGLVFYTNSESVKGDNIRYNPHVGLLFYWRSLDRQIRINGVASPVDPAEADVYFPTRPRISRIGAWASQQSRPMADFGVLQQAVAEAEQKFPDDNIPRPPHWYGYRVVPDRFEFWIQEAGRLHQRIRYSRRDSDQDSWDKVWLFP